MCFVTVFVLNFPCNCTLAFVAELPRLCLCTCFRITLVFPIYFRGGIWTICFRGFAFVHVSDLFSRNLNYLPSYMFSELTSGVSDLLSQRNLNYLLPRLCLRSFSDTVFWTLTLSQKKNNSALQFLRNKTIACNQNTVKAILFLVQLWLTIFSCFDLCAVRFRSVLRLCWFDLNLSVTCLQCP